MISLFTLHFVQFSRYNALRSKASQNRLGSLRSPFPSETDAFVRAWMILWITNQPQLASLAVFLTENRLLCPRSVYPVRIQSRFAYVAYILLCDFLLSQGLVGLSGLEPPTSRLSGARSNRLSYKPISLGQRALRVSASFPYSPPPSAFSDLGGDEENRTPDPLLARQVLSQLSYTPGFHR